MSGALSSAAPARLRQAAGMGVSRLPAHDQSARARQVQILQDWSRPARHCGWLSNRMRLREGDLFGPSLARQCDDDRTPEKEPEALNTPKPQATGPREADTRPRPAFLPPRPSASAPKVASCETARNMPTRMGAGHLRLLNPGDPPEASADAPRPVSRFKPGATRAALPERKDHPDWAEALARAAAPRLDAVAEHSAAPKALAATLQKPVSGPKASYALLDRALSKAAEAPGAGKADRRSSKSATASNAAAKPAASHAFADADAATRTGAEFADLPGAETAATHAAPAAQAPESAAPEFAAPTRLHPGTPDPLGSETVGPPPHVTPVPLPPQPDLAAPFAEVLPHAERSHLRPVQGAVADEPLTELPPAPFPAPAASMPAFDEEDLGDALARVLRDEARRHGIDV